MVYFAVKNYGGSQYPSETGATQMLKIGNFDKVTFDKIDHRFEWKRHNLDWWGESGTYRGMKQAIVATLDLETGYAYQGFWCRKRKRDKQPKPCTMQGKRFNDAALQGTKRCALENDLCEDKEDEMLEITRRKRR